MPRSPLLNRLIRFLWLEKLLRFLARFWPRPMLVNAWRSWPPLAALQAWWARRDSLTRSILSNLVIGLTIAIVLWNLHGFNRLRQNEDAGIDWVMGLQWGVTPARPSLSFALLDIDEATYRQWGEPFHLPRDRVLTLIDYAVRGGAALIVVDIDLSQHGADPAADARLQAYLAQYADPTHPPLILSRVFRESLEPGVTEYPSERRSFLEDDERIARSPLIHWGSPLFNLDDDRVLRRWRLWETVCTNGRTSMIPSMQLLAVALLKSPGKDAGQVGREINKALAPLAPATCEPIKPGTNSPNPADSRPIQIAGLSLHAKPDEVAQRILYTQPWRLKPGQARPTFLSQNGTESPALSIRSALPIGRQAVDSAWLAGRVVVIGASFTESRDRYATPLGQMPGPLVLVNSIQSLYQYGEFTPPPLGVKLLIEAALIVVMSITFAYFNSFWGMVLSGGFIFTMLLPISFMLFRYGVWLDFAIPLIAVQLHQMAVEFKSARAQGTAPLPPPPALDTAQTLAEPMATSAPPPDPTVTISALAAEAAISPVTAESIGETHHEPQPAMALDTAGPDADLNNARRDLDSRLPGRTGAVSAGAQRPGAGD